MFKHLASQLGRWTKTKGYISRTSSLLEDLIGLEGRRTVLSIIDILHREDVRFLRDLEAACPAVAHQPKHIAKCHDLADDDFYARFARPGIPVVLDYSPSYWPRLDWTWSTLSTLHGNQELWVRYGPDYDSMQHRLMSISDYIAAIQNGESFYMANNSLPESMRLEVRFPPYFDRASYNYNLTRLWIGGNGSGAHLHRDLTDNFILQIIGTKQIMLSPPNQTPFLYTWEVNRYLTSSKVSAFFPNYGKLPKAKYAYFISVDLQPGDLLYIPCGWYHQVNNIGNVCSINFFRDSACSQLPSWDAKRRDDALQRV
jgi:hypothetical protein